MTMWLTQGDATTAFFRVATFAVAVAAAVVLAVAVTMYMLGP